MTIRETCTCGASLEYTSPSSEDIRARQKAFHWAHETCRKPAPTQADKGTEES